MDEAYGRLILLLVISYTKFELPEFSHVLRSEMFSALCSCRSTPEVELTLLAFALARGSVAKVLSSLCTVTDHLDTHYDASSLISSMASVRQNLLLKYGK